MTRNLGNVYKHKEDDAFFMQMSLPELKNFLTERGIQVSG